MTERVTDQSHSVAPRQVLRFAQGRGAGSDCFAKRRVAVARIQVDATGRAAQRFGREVSAINGLDGEKQDRVPDAHLAATVFRPVPVFAESLEPKA